MNECLEGLLGGSWSDVIRAVWLRGLFSYWSDKEAGDIVDRIAVDQRLKEIGSCCQECEKADDGELDLVIFGKLEQRGENAAAALTVCLRIHAIGYVS